MKRSNEVTQRLARHRRQSAHKLRLQLDEFGARNSLTKQQILWCVSCVLRELLSEEVEFQEDRLFGEEWKPPISEESNE